MCEWVSQCAILLGELIEGRWSAYCCFSDTSFRCYLSWLGFANGFEPFGVDCAGVDRRTRSLILFVEFGKLACCL